MTPLVVAGSTAGIALGVAVAQGLSAPRRALRRARRSIRRTGRAVARAARPLDRSLDDLARALRPFVRAQKEHDLAVTPLRSLRDVGVSHIRWGVVESAGIETLGDLDRWTERRLIDLDGVGEKSARELLEGVRHMRARIDAEPPRPPLPELSEKGAPKIAALALDTLDLLDSYGAADTLRSDLARLERARGVLARELRFPRAALSFLRPRRQAEWVARAVELARSADRLLSGDLFSQLAKASAPARGGRPEKGSELVDAYGERFASCAAVIERALGGAGSGAIASALSSELLAAIDDCTLRLGGLDFTLRGYQDFGARFILARGRTLLGDEMGLGKTVQALAAATTLTHESPGARILVAMPASLLHQWVRTVRTRTRLAVGLAHGSEKEPAVAQWLATGGVLAVSYATLRTLDLARRLDASGVAIDLAVADEAHYVKNPAAKRTQALTALFERSERRCLMTGTPLENHPDEFQRILTLLDPDLEAHTERGRHDRDSGFLDPTLFRRRVAEVYLRRTQKDVLTELPARIEQEEWVELTPAERSAYDAAVGEGNFMAMRRLTTIGAAESAKFARLAECLEEHREEGRKVLIFSYFLDVLARLAEEFVTGGTIHGGVAPAERDVLITRFREAPPGAILLGQIVAAGVGLDLQDASAVVLVEPQLKPALEAQAIARAHRMGQTRRIIVHRLLAEDTVDAHLRTRLAMKEELFDRYVEGSLLEAASGSAGRDAAPEDSSGDAESRSIAEEAIAAERARLGGTS